MKARLIRLGLTFGALGMLVMVLGAERWG